MTSINYQHCLINLVLHLSLDGEGRVVRINYNNATRDSVLDLPLHQVQPFYRALKAYVDIMNRAENVVTYRMEPGQCAASQNLI